LKLKDLVDGMEWATTHVYHTRLPHTFTTHETQKIKMKRCRVHSLIVLSGVL
jgi:hypothetical protein